MGYSRNRYTAATAIIVVSFPGAMEAQSPDWTAPRTPDGHPELQGTWGSNSVTPLERQTWLADKSTLTNNESIFEYACHEGNIGMEGILAGARAD